MLELVVLKNDLAYLYSQTKKSPFIRQIHSSGVKDGFLSQTDVLRLTPIESY